MVGDILSEQLYLIISYTTTSFACLFNVLLIYVLFVTEVPHIGPYRWLLMAFAIIDVCITINHSITLPTGHLTEFGYFVISLRFIDMSTNFGFLSLLCWTFLFYQTFILLAFHYVYRFVVLCKPPWLSWMQRHPWRNWVLAAILADLMYSGSIVLLSIACWSPSEQNRRAFAPVMKELYGIDLKANNLPGYLAFTIWIPLENGEKEWQSASNWGIAFVDGILVASGAVIVYCIVRIVSVNLAVRNHTVSKTRRMQLQLFRVLMWQTIIPIFTSYSPVALSIMLPLVFGVQMGDLGTIAISFMQLFPMIDPFLVLLLIPRYRASLPHFIRRPGLIPFTISVSKSTEHIHKVRSVVPSNVIVF